LLSFHIEAGFAWFFEWGPEGWTAISSTTSVTPFVSTSVDLSFWLETCVWSLMYRVSGTSMRQATSKMADKMTFTQWIQARPLFPAM
jgi:hypothetical protein